MRRRLIWVFVAISGMVALAFVVPLGFLVARTAEDRAIDAARSDASAIVPVLVADTTISQVQAAMSATQSGIDGRMTVVTVDGSRVGADASESVRLADALATGASEVGHVDGGDEVVLAVATGPDALSAVRVFVPEDELREGVLTSWAALAVVAAGLMVISVVVADRLARSIVTPAQDLAAAASALAAGDLDARVDPSGPAEIEELSVTFNQLAGEVAGMLEREREFVADLSHRLRTPLTKLRMRIDEVPDDGLAAQLGSDADAVAATVTEVIAEARSRGSDVVEQTDAQIVVSERATFWSALAEDQGRPWQLTTSGSPAWVRLDPVTLAAAVDVLVENVFAHTPDDAPIGLTVRSQESVVLVTVADGGPSFALDALGRGVSGADSTGLGLDIARRTALEAGGSLTVGPSELGGAAVTMRLPRLSPSEIQ